MRNYCIVTGKASYISCVHVVSFRKNKSPMKESDSIEYNNAVVLENMHNSDAGYGEVYEIPYKYRCVTINGLYVRI